MRKSNGILARIFRVLSCLGRRRDGKGWEGLGGIHNPGNMGGRREIPLRFSIFFLVMHLGFAKDLLC